MHIVFDFLQSISICMLYVVISPVGDANGSYIQRICGHLYLTFLHPNSIKARVMYGSGL